MVETIETFISKLHEDGVQAGQQAAQEIIEKAEQQARQRLAEAEEQAEQIVQQARQEAERNRVRVETEFKLAARDIVFRVQGTLNQVLQAVLADAVDAKLADAEFLGGLIHDVVMQYVTADATGGDAIEVSVSEDMRKRLLSGAVNAFRPDQAEQARIKLVDQLNKAGFEYKVAGATVEITDDSVVQLLSEFLGAELRRRVEEERSRQNAEA